jgi:hypothetical protein
MNIQFRKNKKGQAFESYRYLIAFAIGVAVLTIIYTMIGSINQKSILISTQRLKEGALSASKSIRTSGEKPFYLDDLMLSGEISSAQISNYTGMSSDCIYLVGGVGLEEKEPGKIYSIQKSHLKMDVYFYCDFTEDPLVTDNNVSFITNSMDSNTCPTFCIVYLNTSPPVIN